MMSEKKQVYLQATGGVMHKGIERALALCDAMGGDREEMHKAIGLAMRRAMEAGRTAAKRQVTARYRLSSSRFLKHTKIANSHIENEDNAVTVKAYYYGHNIPLVEFSTGGNNKRGVTAAVRKDSAEKRITGAFYADIAGYRSIYQREGYGRFPLKTKYGPSTAVMLANEEVTAEADRAAAETFERRIEHEIWRIWNGIGG